MSIGIMIEVGMQAFKEKMVTLLEDVVKGDLTPISAHMVAGGLQQAIAAAGAGAFRAVARGRGDARSAPAPAGAGRVGDGAPGDSAQTDRSDRLWWVLKTCHTVSGFYRLCGERVQRVPRTVRKY